MYTVSRTFDTAEEAINFLKGAPTKGTSGKKTAKKEEEEGGEDDDLAALLGGGEEEGGEDEVTVEMIQEKVTKLAKAGHKEKIAALLTKFKAAGVSKLSETKYADFMTALGKIK